MAKTKVEFVPMKKNDRERLSAYDKLFKGFNFDPTQVKATAFRQELRDLKKAAIAMRDDCKQWDPENPESYGEWEYATDIADLLQFFGIHIDMQTPEEKEWCRQHGGSGY